MNILPKGVFPSQAVSNAEKASEKYGLEIARAVESEWFKRDSGTARYYANRDNFHRLRLYARGEQSIQKYKDELSINGDLSYLNLDWKPVPIIPKFVDIVVNGISERTYDIKAYSQDPFGVQKRTEYMQSILDDMRTQEINDFADQELKITDSKYKSYRRYITDWGNLKYSSKQLVVTKLLQAMRYLGRGSELLSPMTSMVKYRSFTSEPAYDVPRTSFAKKVGGAALGAAIII